jgi:hypothetical protein
MLHCNVQAELAGLLYIIIHSGYFSAPNVLMSYAGFGFNPMNALNRCSLTALFPTTPKVLMSYAGFIFNPTNALNRCSFAALFPPTSKPSCLSTSVSVAACMVPICPGNSGNPATSVLFCEDLPFPIAHAGDKRVQRLHF